jgi:hypothetical protein
VLEASHDYVNYRRAGGRQDAADPAALARELLLARSRVDAPPQTPGVASKEGRPEEGHGSSRIGLGAGRFSGRDFAELRLRPAYHDILDADQGYVRGAQIEFFSFALRRYRHGSTQLESFTPIDILSLSPRDEFFQSWSWKVAAGWRRAFVRDGSRPLAASVDGGVGGAWSSAGDRMLLYAFLDGSTRLHSRLEHGYALGAGGRVGALVDMSPRWRMHAYGRALRYFLGEHDTPRSLGLEQRVRLGRDLAISLDLSRNREAGRSYNAGTVSVLFYQ